MADRARDELAGLIKEGSEILRQETAGSGAGSSRQSKSKDRPIGDYQSWYSRALAVVRQLLPDRLDEFREQYRPEKRKEIDVSTYTISDYLLGIRLTQLGEDVFDHKAVFESRFVTQILILKSAVARLESLLADIRAVLHAEVLDSEISVARELLKKGHVRAAGAISGVVLEGHLKTALARREVVLKKKAPTLNDLAEMLRAESAIDVPTWRLLQRMADIRNLCVHAKERDPTQDEVEELVNSTDRLTKHIF